jgi:hypothetical protein
MKKRKRETKAKGRRKNGKIQRGRREKDKRLRI